RRGDPGLAAPLRRGPARDLHRTRGAGRRGRPPAPDRGDAGLDGAGAGVPGARRPGRSVGRSSRWRGARGRNGTPRTGPGGAGRKRGRETTTRGEVMTEIVGPAGVA